MRKVAILGPGLLGGSLALALKAQAGKAQSCVSLWARRAEAVAEAEALGIADEVSGDLSRVVAGASTVILCTPVEVMPGLAREIAPLLEPGTVVTDVGSVKRKVVEALVPVFEPAEVHFIGSHPMAGSEQSGIAAARKDLFEGAVCIVTPHAGASELAVESVRTLWKSVGCRVERLAPEIHDEMIGLVSHLPHFLAAALVDFVQDENANAVGFCGNGFRDTTRIASGPAAMWRGIFASNRAALVPQLRAFNRSLKAATDLLEQGDDDAIEDFLQRAKAARDLL